MAHEVDDDGIGRCLAQRVERRGTGFREHQRLEGSLGEALPPARNRRAPLRLRRHEQSDAATDTRLDQGSRRGLEGPNDGYARADAAEPWYGSARLTPVSSAESRRLSSAAPPSATQRLKSPKYTRTRLAASSLSLSFSLTEWGALPPIPIYWACGDHSTPIQSSSIYDGYGGHPPSNANQAIHFIDTIPIQFEEAILTGGSNPI